MKLEMFTTIQGSYLDWAFINYQPVMKEISLESLEPHLKSVRTAIDVGCSKGWATIHLARKGIEAAGISLNPNEVELAKERARNAGLKRGIRFIAGDILAEKNIPSFDLVLLVRLLTCFPLLKNWNQLLDRVYQLMNPNGIIYIYDFLYNPNSDTYRERYLDGIMRGWRLGNFKVADKNGNCLFVAHHHTGEELDRILQPYEQLCFARKNSLSMNGNEALVFEFIGKKKVKD